MVTPSPRKLAASMVAQATSFVVVLVIGAFIPRSPHAPTPPPEFRLTVRVAAEPSDMALAGRQVGVLKDAALTSAASGRLNAAGAFTTRVSPGSYQVCISVPAHWRSANVNGTHTLPGWICSTADVGTSPRSVTFRLIPQSASRQVVK